MEMSFFRFAKVRKISELAKSLFERLCLTEPVLKSMYPVYQAVERQALAIDEGLLQSLIIGPPVGQKNIGRTNHDSVGIVAVVIHIFQAIIFLSVLFNCPIQCHIRQCRQTVFRIHHPLQVVEVPAHAETARVVVWGRTDFLQEHISPFLDGLGSTALDRH